MYHQEQAIARQEFRQISIGMLARNNLIHRIVHGFQPLKLLNLMDHGRLIHIEQRMSPAQKSQQVQ